MKIAYRKSVILPLMVLKPGAAIAEAPLNYFLHAHGPAALPTQMLDWIFTALMVSVCLIIVVLLIIAVIRKRPVISPASIVVESNGLRWVAMGAGLTITALFVMTIYMLVILNNSTLSQKPAFTITVTGYDWWWKVNYPDFETANEIHIPVGVPVRLVLKSADVIHAFWVPQLAGKTEMIPGLTNEQWLQADDPGVYRGQCTQFCGAEHAHMAFEVIAEGQEQFEAWEAKQRSPATSQSSTGQHVFMRECAGCHTVRGTAAKGAYGPDLTHIGSRRMLAAGLLSNNPEHLLQWVSHAQELKPDALMPDFPLSPDESNALVSYLATLK